MMAQNSGITWINVIYTDIKPNVKDVADHRPSPGRPQGTARRDRPPGPARRDRPPGPARRDRPPGPARCDRPCAVVTPYRDTQKRHVLAKQPAPKPSAKQFVMQVFEN